MRDAATGEYWFMQQRSQVVDIGKSELQNINSILERPSTLYILTFTLDILY